MREPDLHHVCDYGFGPPIHEPPVLLGTCRDCGAQVVKIPVMEEDTQVLLALAPCSTVAVRALAVLEIEPPWLIRAGEMRGLWEQSCRGPPEDQAFWESEIGQKILGAFELIHNAAQ